MEEERNEEATLGRSKDSSEGEKRSTTSDDN